jgi:hypothetical protein
MDYTRLQARVMFTPPQARGGVQLQAGAMHTSPAATSAAPPR